MSRIIISDIHSNNNGGNCTGHYIALARMYLTLFKDLAEVKAASGPVYSRYIDADSLIRLPYDMVAGENYLLGRIKALLNARALFRKASDDVVILQDGRPMTNHIGTALFCRKKQKLYMIKYTKAGLSSFFGKLVWKMIKGRVAGVICPNAEVGEAFGVPYCVVPDYIYSGEGGRCPVDYDEKEYDFCIVGRLNPDKGVDKSLMALSGSSYRILVAGKADNESFGNRLKEISEDSSAIDLRLGYLSDEDYQTYLNSSRYCLLNYQGAYSERSSGVVLDTIFSGVPVVGNRCKALQFVEDNSLGFLFDSLEDLASADLFSKERYESYLRNIDDYRQKNRDFATTLHSFVNQTHE